MSEIFNGMFKLIIVFVLFIVIVALVTNYPAVFFIAFVFFIVLFSIVGGLLFSYFDIIKQKRRIENQRKKQEGE